MLVYDQERSSGIRRKRAGRGWCYRNSDGSRITDRSEIERLNAIRLPPAYQNAWFSANPSSHIQATGYDARGRKQYRYHPAFRARKEAEKFDRCLEFGLVLPTLRRCVERDLQTRGLTKAKGVAAIVRLLDSAVIRIGNENYVKDNKSFGATTLRMRHARLNGATLRLRFMAKSGKQQEIEITDPLLACVVKRCQDLPGQHLFGYADEEGEVHNIGSTDVNDYIREVTGANFTAKHFRTWWASVIAYSVLCSSLEKTPTMAELLEPVTQALGNTPAIARKSYVHPALLAQVEASEELESRMRPVSRATKYLSAAERGFIAFLREIS